VTSTCGLTGCGGLQDPVSAPDGRAYERHAIEEWLSRNAASPFTSQPMSIEDLRPVPGFGEALHMLQQFGSDRQVLIHRIAMIRSLVNSPMQGNAVSTEM
jgi:hypothetical protein